MSSELSTPKPPTKPSQSEYMRKKRQEYLTLRRYACKRCECCFRDKARLTKHERVCALGAGVGGPINKALQRNEPLANPPPPLPLPPYTCLGCWRLFMDRSEAMHHMNLWHGFIQLLRSLPPVYECFLCGCRFEDHVECRNHEDLHDFDFS